VVEQARPEPLLHRLHEMEVFVAIADAGSFAKAGKRLRISPPAVTRALSSLEERVGARLLNRTTRSLGLTEAGIRFLERAKRLLATTSAPPAPPPLPNPPTCGGWRS